MNERERKEQVSLPACPNPDCRESHVVRNGSHRGRPRYHCRSCKMYFGETQGTPMYGLKTPAAEVAQALLIVMRRGSLRVAEAGGSACRGSDAGTRQRSAPEPGGNR